MKRIPLAALLLTCVLAQAAQEKTVKSTIKNVTVFTQGAQVFRTTAVQLQPGMTCLVFDGVSPFINASTIQAGGKGKFIVLDVKHHIRYPEPPAETAEILPKEIVKETRQLEDSLIILGFDKDELTEKEKALLLEKNMIEKNKLALGEGKSDSLAVLKQAMEFFRSKLSDINAQLSRLRREGQRLQARIDRMALRLRDLKTFRNDRSPVKKYEPVHEVWVNVSTEEPVTGLVEVSYLVSHAGWTPSYDLRSNSTSAPIQLTYKANVYQQTGEDWEAIDLKLSTGNPNRSASKPELPVWYINYYFPQRAATTDSKGLPSAINETITLEREDLSKKMSELSAAQTTANYTQIIETLTQVEFDVKIPCTIPSDGTTHTVPVKSEALPATYTHYLVPKLEQEAFLLARVTGWEALSLLPGAASVFFDGTYVGQTMLNPVLLDDTMDLSLGRDRGITVSRTKLPATEKNKLLGNEITKTFTYELKMKNNKGSKVNLVIQDQIPVAQNKEIKVALTDGGKAEYESTTGLLRWDTTLNSRENKSLSFSYAVTYTKGMQLSMH